MKRSPIKKKGKRTNEWDRIRASLKVSCEKNGITRCEMCGTDFALTFAHRKPRRYCSTEELRAVALVCQPHHKWIDDQGHEAMFRLVDEIIEKRGFAL